jgi:hypothetical protein
MGHNELPIPPAGAERIPETHSLPIRRVRKGSVRATVTWALGQIDDPYWPIGLCVAWVPGREKSKAVRLYSRRCVFAEARPIKHWADARTTLLRALAGGRIEAWGVRPKDGQRVLILPQEWIDLRIQQRGPYDEVRGRDGLIAYREVKIAAAMMRREFPAQTAATKRAHEKQEGERACLEALKQRMKEKPNEPVGKEILRREFDDISERAFIRCYGRAAQETGAAAWTKAGRRRRQPTD